MSERMKGIEKEMQTKITVMTATVIFLMYFHRNISLKAKINDVRVPGR